MKNDKIAKSALIGLVVAFSATAQAKTLVNLPSESRTENPREAHKKVLAHAETLELDFGSFDSLARNQLSLSPEPRNAF